MDYKKHVAAGFIANALAFSILSQSKLFSFNALFNPQLALTTLLAIVLFSILPDIDSINSLASRLLRWFLVLVMAFSALEFFSTKSFWALAKIGFAVLVLAGHFLYAKRGKMHRQFPHTLAFGAMACIAVFLLTGSKTVAFAGGVAFLFHLLLDGWWKRLIPGF